MGMQDRCEYGISDAYIHMVLNPLEMPTTGHQDTIINQERRQRTMKTCKLTVTKESDSSPFKVFCDIDANPDKPIFSNSYFTETLDYLVSFKEMNPQLETSIDIQVPIEVVASSLRNEGRIDDL